jgi:D-alanyl-D-alanine carboxypeptidase (penicillin-binding protein 5/6)
MKKNILLTLFALIISTFNIFFSTSNKIIATEENSSNPPISINAPIGLLMEFSTGQIIYRKNINERKYPASMTKMMGLFIILEKIRDHSISYDDIVTVSDNAASMGGSQVFLEPGEQITVNDLFKAICIASANDAIVALGEHTFGSEQTFINKMNETAKRLGMNDTNFVNPTGFHDPNHYTTANDMATLALALLTNFQEDVLKYTSMYEGYIRESSEKPFWLVNTNKLVRFYEGMDGLKTGYTSDSGFNLTATAQRNGLRFITVVMDAETSSSRNADTTNLMNYGFNNYKVVTLYKKGETISNYSFHNAKTENTPIIAKEDITYVTKKNEQPTTMNVTVEITQEEAPINPEDKIGRVIITNPNTGWQTFFDIYSKNNVEKLKFKDIFMNYWKALIN